MVNLEANKDIKDIMQAYSNSIDDLAMEISGDIEELEHYEEADEAYKILKAAGEKIEKIGAPQEIKRWPDYDDPLQNAIKCILGSCDEHQFKASLQLLLSAMHSDLMLDLDDLQKINIVLDQVSENKKIEVTINIT